MSNLLHIQTKFQEYLLHTDHQIQQDVVSTEKISAELRLAIYSDAYRSRLLESLATTYPILKIYMGDDDFEKLSNEYIDKFPSTYKSIRWFGDHLADFLARHSTYKNSNYLSELALLEWTMTLVFDAADDAVLQLDDMGKIPPESWENMRLYAHPSIQRIKLSWNVVHIWQAVTDEKTPGEPIQSQFPIEWVFWRNELMNHFCSLSESEAWAIDAMLNGSSFGDICAGLCKWVSEEDAAMHSASLLKGWISAGLLSSVIS